MNPIGIASDHGGYELKSKLIENIPQFSFIDCGTHSKDSVHYPHFADELCRKIISGTIEKGILICGTGIGISIRANRYPRVRAALVYDSFTAKMAKAHNNANIICLGGRTTSLEIAIECVHVWNSAEFESGRHETRVDMLDDAIL